MSATCPLGRASFEARLRLAPQDEEFSKMFLILRRREAASKDVQRKPYEMAARPSGVIATAAPIKAVWGFITTWVGMARV